MFQFIVTITDHLGRRMQAAYHTLEKNMETLESLVAWEYIRIVEASSEEEAINKVKEQELCQKV